MKAKSLLSLLLASLGTLLAAAPAMAACRAESALNITDIIDASATQVIRVAPMNFTVSFEVKNTQGFVCNGDGGVNKLPPGCTTDGFTFKPELSTNVWAAPQAGYCGGFSVASNTQAGVRAAFRIRFEENKQTPKRRTFVVAVDLSGPFIRKGPIPFTLKVVPDPVE